MSEKQASGRSVETLKTTFKILDSLIYLEGGTVTEIANHTSLAKGTVHAHLKTLHSHDYISKNDHEYRIGLNFLNLGLYAQDSIEGFSKIQAKATNLAQESGELVVFIVEENGAGVVLIRERGPNAVETEVRKGDRVGLHTTAAGKAIMTHIPFSRVEEIISRRGLGKRTDSTITNQKDLFKELKEIRSRGYAISSEEHTSGLYTLGAPVMGSTDHVIGAISLSGPVKRLNSEQSRSELSELLLGAVNELELNIKYA